MINIIKNSSSEGIKDMRTTAMKSQSLFACRRAWMVLLTAFALLGSASVSLAQNPTQKSFSSALEASDALYRAVQDRDERAMEAILGAGKDLTSSGDEVEDQLEREQFKQKYSEMHRLVRENDEITVLYIGAQNWPFPIPLVSRGGRWQFDADEGAKEIAFRCVGEDELMAIQVSKNFVAGVKQGPLSKSNDDSAVQYARQLVDLSSDNATQVTAPTGERQFHGYYFRVLSQDSSKNALRLVAFPAEYGSTGVMTFIVGRDGAVYERDLGPSTDALASRLKEKPASGWRKVKDAELATIQAKTSR